MKKDINLESGESVLLNIKTKLFLTKDWSYERCDSRSSFSIERNGHQWKSLFFLIHWQEFNGNALYCISKFSACVLILLFLVFKIIEYVDVIEIALKLLTEYDTNEYYTSKDFFTPFQ